MIGKSFVELVKYIFTLPDVTSFLSQRVCQDAIEQFFGCQRQRGGGVHDNPSVKEFVANTQALRVINSLTKNCRGNCRGSSLDTCTNLGFENDPLPKRKAHRSKK